MRRALIDDTGLVVNVIEIEAGVNYAPPAGLTLLDQDGPIMGGTWDGTSFHPPPEPAPPEPTETEQKLALLAQLEAAGVVAKAISDGVISAGAAAAAGITTGTDPVAGGGTVKASTS